MDMTPEQAHEIAAVHLADQLNAAWADLQPALEAWAHAIQAAVDAMVALLHEVARRIGAALQPILAAAARRVEAYLTAQRRAQLATDLLWLWLPVGIVGWLAARWPKRYLPALRV